MHSDLYKPKQLFKSPMKEQMKIGKEERREKMKYSGIINTRDKS